MKSEMSIDVSVHWLKGKDIKAVPIPREGPLYEDIWLKLGSRKEVQIFVEYEEAENIAKALRKAAEDILRFQKKRVNHASGQ